MKAVGRSSKPADPMPRAVPRVDLLPPSQRLRRDQGRLIRAWVMGCLAAALVVGLLTGGAQWLRVGAEQELARERARTAALMVELASHSEVTQARAERLRLTELRALALGSDLAWQPILSRVTSALPSGVHLVGFELAPGALPVAAPDDGAVPPERAVGLAGELTLRSTDPGDQAAAVAGLRLLPEAILVDAGRIEAKDGGDYEMVVTVRFDQSVYSRTFAAAETRQR